MTGYDFGYTWIWTHGHLVPAAAFGAAAALAAWRRWPRWLTGVLAVLSLWAVTGFAIIQLVFGANSPMELPTPSFFRRGSGQVLDLGAGSGRSSLMVLLARPAARVTAVDIYEGYFGIDDNTPERIRANARVAGVEDRLDVRKADIRALPFADASYDGAVSAFVIDHLTREGIERSLTEVARVLRPGGEFLLIVLNVDGWVRTAYPLPHSHGYFSRSAGAGRWKSALEKAGLHVVEDGTGPAVLYVLSRKPR
jgi:SAM-dependent methyltransferase